MSSTAATCNVVLLRSVSWRDSPTLKDHWTLAQRCFFVEWRTVESQGFCRRYVEHTRSCLHHACSRDVPQFLASLTVRLTFFRSADRVPSRAGHTDTRTYEARGVEAPGQRTARGRLQRRVRRRIIAPMSISWKDSCLLERPTMTARA